MMISIADILLALKTRFAEGTHRRTFIFLLDYGMAVVALAILLSTIIFLYSAYADETRYVAMLDEPCTTDESLKLCYVPFKIVVDAGAIVMWENIGDQVHTVTSGTLVTPASHFNSGLIAPNSFYSLEFAVGGIYPYYCMVHPWMNGSVVVGEKITEQEKEELVEEELVIILEEGMFTNSTGTFYANGTAVVPEFPFAIIILAVTVTMVIVFSRQKLSTNL
jgi:predicted secreted protein with PEFG-CTERM motif